MDTIRRLLQEKNMLNLQHPETAKRPAAYRETDVAALKAIVQAAINVEEFTIPLYMCSMYSLQGMHAITGKNKLYLGRLWPGMATVAEPATANELAFNQIFKVFIEEMLHLQIIANIAKVVGIDKPCFTSQELMNSHYGWTCYGDDITVIPHIVDFKDLHSETVDYDSLRVKLDALNKQQIDLFMAIEESADLSSARIKADKRDKYFPKAPFEHWQINDALPMFGSIGWLYVCLWQYVELRYDDGISLWETVYNKQALERDLFNNTALKEYPDMRVKVNDIGAEVAPLAPEQAKENVLDMISGITDQGEGQTVSDIIREHLHQQQEERGDAAVRWNYQADLKNLQKRYPSYNDNGGEMPSADAAARASKPNVHMDHFEIFAAIKERLCADQTDDPIITWDQWHAQGHTWTPDALKTADYHQNKFNDKLPSADEIAGALNRLKDDQDNEKFKVLSQASAGAIKGITTVLDDYWCNENITFPFPSMAGSGDRMSICWAVFGKAPDLSLGTPGKIKHRMYHACQGLKLDAQLPDQPDGCALVEVYHTCKGSNTCKGESGCGFVQHVGGGSNCNHPVTGIHLHEKNQLENDNSPIYYSTPSDNKCAGQGGCAVPISASQLHFNPGAPKSPQDTQTMAVFDIQQHDETLAHFKYGESPYEEGALVHDVAWEAYIKVLEANNETVPDKPQPSDLRLAFPPST